MSRFLRETYIFFHLKIGLGGRRSSTWWRTRAYLWCIFWARRPKVATLFSVVSPPFGKQRSLGKGREEREWGGGGGRRDFAENIHFLSLLFPPSVERRVNDILVEGVIRNSWPASGKQMQGRPPWRCSLARVELYALYTYLMFFFLFFLKTKTFFKRGR